MYESSEYPGYDSTWVLGQERDVSYYRDDYYRGRSYASYDPYSRPRSGYYPRGHNDYPGGAELAWVVRNYLSTPGLCLGVHILQCVSSLERAQTLGLLAGI
jgi:hypothetical protein